MSWRKSAVGIRDIWIRAKWIHAFSVFYFLFITLSVVYSCIFIAYPVVYKEDKVQKTNNIMFLLYLFFNIMGNYFLGLKCNSFFKSGMVLVDPPRSWTLCNICNQHSPPRSHHCPICNVCVLKRDHHCYFLCQCVGLRNQKFFMIFAMYVAIGSFYAMKVLLAYLDIAYVPVRFTYFSISSYIFPMLLYNWLHSSVTVTFTTCFCLLILYCCFSAGSGCLFLFLFQCILVYRGQTTYELLQRTPSSASITNFSQVFGSWWPLHFFIPLPIRSKEEKSPWGYPVYYKSV